jgi:hypothetical protein
MKKIILLMVLFCIAAGLLFGGFFIRDENSDFHRNNIMDEKGINFQGAQLPPVINSFTASTNIVKPYDTITLTLSATDPNGDELTNTYVFPSEYCSLSDFGNNPVVQVSNMLGQFSITVLVDDGITVVSNAVTILVTNTVPVINDFYASNSGVSNHIIIMKTSKSISLACDAGDVDGDSLTYDFRIISGGGALSNASGPAVTYYSPSAHTDVELEVVVSDGYDGADTNTLSLKVSDYIKICDTNSVFAGALTAGANYGKSVCSIGDLNNDGNTDLAVGCFNDDDVFANSGSVYIMFMSNNGLVSSYRKISPLSSDFTNTIKGGDRFGTSVAFLGDVKGDGSSALAVGANMDDDKYNTSGSVWILFLNQNADVLDYTKISPTNGNLVNDLTNNDRFGSSCSSLGDLNEDGVPDLAVGSINTDGGGNSRGAVWILFLSNDGTVLSNTNIIDTDADFVLELNDFDQMGYSVTFFEDFNGDTVDDNLLSTGAILGGAGATSEGAVLNIRLDSDGTINSPVNQKMIAEDVGGLNENLSSTARFGRSLAALPDMNGDSYRELAVGANGDGAGDIDSVYIMFLNSSYQAIGYQQISSNSGGFNGLETPDSGFGSSVCYPGDINLDGIPDIVVGADNDASGGTGTGAVWVLFLNQDGTVKQ